MEGGDGESTDEVPDVKRLALIPIDRKSVV